jgi:transposase
MNYILSGSREQVFFSSLEEQVSAYNTVRFIDAFVEKIDLAQLHFVVKEIKAEGRPAFNPKLFLKLYIYGYLNGIRSSRRLENECKRNIELHWLMGKLVPNYHGISDFRKVNAIALRNTFKPKIIISQKSLMTVIIKKWFKCFHKFGKLPEGFVCFFQISCKKILQKNKL